MIKIKGLLNKVRRVWTSLISNVKNFFSGKSPDVSSNKQNSNENGHIKKLSVKETKNEIDLEDEQDVWYDALTEYDEEEYFDAAEDLNEQENSERKKIYESDKFYSAKDLQEVHEFIDHSNTFAIAIFEHSIDKLSGCYNYQLASLQLNNNEESRACVLSFKQSNIKISSDHVRLYMPLYFESKKQESINHLFQYKNGTPSIVMLLEKPNSINLDPNFGWTEYVYSTVWSKIKESETKKSTKISKTLFPTFTIELLEGQNLSLSINKDAIPESIENLKDEKPTIKKILAIPGVPLLINKAINNIVDKVTSGKKETNFRIRDILIDGKTINKLQNSVQNSKNEHRFDDQHKTSSPNLELKCVEKVALSSKDRPVGV